ncbi:hypothetical protein NDU88_005164 [Pleurodeles waltl]|uniref:Uncharacterized protein n=1 Tax=Pleurodeles waltl TaxID=8319 RepID=A0AAV7WB34_PLEWA|nr:hypothetical protein NDU88_005164 [Pleurodeles waltl]
MPDPTGLLERQRGAKRRGLAPFLPAAQGDSWWDLRHKKAETGPAFATGHDWVPKTERQRKEYGCPTTEEISESGFLAPAHGHSATQSEEVKKLALQAAASLTDPDLSYRKGAGTDRDHDSDTHLSDPDFRECAPEDLP